MTMMCSVCKGSKPGCQEQPNQAGSAQLCPVPLSWTHASELPHARASPALLGCPDSAPSSPSASSPPQPSSAETPQWRWYWHLPPRTWPSAAPSLQRNPVLLAPRPRSLHNPLRPPISHITLTKMQPAFVQYSGTQISRLHRCIATFLSC